MQHQAWSLCILPMNDNSHDLLNSQTNAQATIPLITLSFSSQTSPDAEWFSKAWFPLDSPPGSPWHVQRSWRFHHPPWALQTASFPHLQLKQQQQISWREFRLYRYLANAIASLASLASTQVQRKRRLTWRLLNGQWGYKPWNAGSQCP